MYDGHHDDWKWADAVEIVEHSNGCGNCPSIDECRAEGACIKHLDADATKSATTKSATTKSAEEEPQHEGSQHER